MFSCVCSLVIRLVVLCPHSPIMQLKQQILLLTASASCPVIPHCLPCRPKLTKATVTSSANPVKYWLYITIWSTSSLPKLHYNEYAFFLPHDALLQRSVCYIRPAVCIAYMSIVLKQLNWCSRFFTQATFDLPTLCYKGIRGISKITVGLYFPVEPYRKVRI